ncbi:hypothetical protein I302_100958 [Kwoniella bestiolae CBS 10118]|uniref:Uncharacterized protein n=1 Tax=Kwoniella bestiolae CBS 10118 TaxID=1296100 RepID=A0A1B9G6I6_9TREE|nr:hypothetical protein I302_04335 [Kwoniella bestiolae CBS 10118]OCF26649.1 hypothetical protein I302_04335 [Kwoniella bestiolae CBS 10118]
MTMISTLIPILGFLATSITAINVHSSVWLPEYTRIGNQWGELDGPWGPGFAQDQFSRSQLAGEGTTKTDADGWNRREVFWYIYKNTGTMRYKTVEEGAQPINPLGKEYILWNMTCYDAVHVSSDDAANYLQKLDLSVETIVRPWGGYDWESLKGKANFYCPKGQCIHDQCRGKDAPTWDHSIFDQQHNNDTATRVPIDQ